MPWQRKHPKFTTDGKKKSVKAIYSACKKRRGRSRYLLSVNTAIQKDDSIMSVKLVFVRNRNKRNDYLVLITTDLTLSVDDIIRIYGKR
ncbi:hypothetical protein [Acetobacterium sp.]|uniref:hypothetical protein n=1 Tax=Acetobacterium sp. TaxID=1872094 RepID=UPI0035932605